MTKSLASAALATALLTTGPAEAMFSVAFDLPRLEFPADLPTKIPSPTVSSKQSGE